VSRIWATNVAQLGVRAQAAWETAGRPSLERPNPGSGPASRTSRRSPWWA